MSGWVGSAAGEASLQHRRAQNCTEHRAAWGSAPQRPCWRLSLFLHPPKIHP